MTRSIPKINIDFASTLPLIIANALYKGNAGSPIFTHVKIGIDIDFYCFKPNWELLIWKIDDKSLNDEEGNPLTWKTVEPFLKDYSRGFQDGYFEFDNLLKEGQYFQNDEIKARKIFEYSNSWRSGPFREQAGNGNPGTYITKDLWYEDGREAGYFYKSWQIIVENHEMFIGYFSEQTQLPKERQIADESEKKTGPMDYLSAAQMALFVYYLAEGEVFPHPSNNQWESLLQKCGYLKSYKAVKNQYSLIAKGKTTYGGRDPRCLDNLTVLINGPLKKHPPALKKAKKEHSEISKEIDD